MFKHKEIFLNGFYKNLTAHLACSIQILGLANPAHGGQSFSEGGYYIDSELKGMPFQ